MIELSAANLYTRLADRAKSEGKTDLFLALSKMAREERSQAQRIDPDIKTGRLKGKDQWSHYWYRGQPANRAASLGSRDSRVSRYLGPSPESQPWDLILPKLGSAEFLIALYYLVFLRDFKTFKEEIEHAKKNTVRLEFLARGIRCLF
jgi:hypothetical protein